MIPLKVTDVGGGAGEIREWAVGDTLPVSLGGTGAVDAAAARTNLGLGSAAVAAILGTVSQSGGVPTGAIVQRGSNANGWFVRLADGTQICGRFIALTGFTLAAGGVANFGDWTYPAAFVAVSIAFCTGRDTYAEMLKGNLFVYGETSGTMQFRNVSTTPMNSVSVNVDLLAIGRWF